MNRRITTVGLLVAMFGMSAAAALPPEPSLSFSADCTGTTIAVSGWPEGSRGQVGIDASPPRALDLNATTALAWSFPADQHWYSILILDAAGGRRVENGSVDCAVPVVEVEPVAAEPVPVAVATIEPAGIDYSIWSHVELAPPW